jgi:hypothetical protein
MRREKTQTNKTRNENGDITTTSMKSRRSLGILQKPIFK